MINSNIPIFFHFLFNNFAQNLSKATFPKDYKTYVFQLVAIVDISESGDINVDSKINDTHLVVSWEFINNIITFFTVSPYTAGSLVMVFLKFVFGLHSLRYYVEIGNSFHTDVIGNLHRVIQKYSRYD